MSLFEKVFGKKEDSLFSSVFEKDEEKKEKYPYGITARFNYDFSPNVSDFVLKLINEGERVYNYSIYIVVVMGKYHYALWNNNYYYAWLCRCDRWWQIPVVREKKIESNLWLPYEYEKITEYEWKCKQLWDEIMPEPSVMKKFEEYCIKNDIYIDAEKHDKGKNNVDTEFMEKVLSKDKIKEKEKGE